MSGGKIPAISTDILEDLYKSHWR